MDKKFIIDEAQVKDALDKVINEQISKVSREEFTTIKLRINDLQKALNKTLDEMRELEESIPNNLKSITKGRTNKISAYLYNGQYFLNQLKNKLELYRRSTSARNISEKNS